MTKPWYQRAGSAISKFFNNINEKYIQPLVIKAKIAMLDAVSALGQDSGGVIAGIRMGSIMDKRGKLADTLQKREATGLFQRVETNLNAFAGTVERNVSRLARTGDQGEELRDSSFGTVVKVFFKALAEKIGRLMESPEKTSSLSIS